MALDLQFAGYSLRSSPFEPGLWAVATSANFGIVGNGRLHVVRAVLQDRAVVLQPVCSYDTNHGLYDCAWSEQSERHLLCASADGSVKLYDISAATGGRPVMAFCEHQAEVNSVDFNLRLKESFASASWDGSVRVWRAERPESLLILAEHSHVVYECRWAPHHPSQLLSASGDRTVKLWDAAAGCCSVMTISCGACEVLSCDWSKYDPNTFATGSVDKTVALWDVRFPATPTAVLPAHTYAVRRVRFNPHTHGLLALPPAHCAACNRPPKGPLLARRRPVGIVVPV